MLFILQLLDPFSVQVILVGCVVCGALTGGRNSIAVRRLAVREVPRRPCATPAACSAPGADENVWNKVDSTAIIKAVKEVIKE